MKVLVMVYTKKVIERSLIRAASLQSKVAGFPVDRADVFRQKLKVLLESTESKTFLIKLLDRGFRANKSRVTANVIRKLLNGNSSKVKLFGKQERVLVDLFRFVGFKFSALSVPLVLKRIRKLTAEVVHSAKPTTIIEHAQKYRKQGVLLNTNLIGETLLGEKEALQRIKAYEELLDNPEVDYISIKVSTIYSQLHSIAFEHTVEKLVERLTLIYSHAIKQSVKQNKEKFVNLDMEEYRDLELTVETFKQILELPQFFNYRAGIVLQAYLPDSFSYLQDLQQWAKHRIKKGGAPIKIRIVKGANMEMEKTEASLYDWELTTFREKADSDANYKKMLLQALKKDCCTAVNIGVASHNVFDLSLAMELVREEKVEEFVTIEMLEGMAKELTTIIHQEAFQVLLYSPIVHAKDFTNAVAYLVRRLDECTSKGNFLREGFGLKPYTDKWQEEEKKYLATFERIEELRAVPFRQQNRLTEEAVLTSLNWKFKNESNTDWVLLQNRVWLNDIKAKWEIPLNQISETINPVGVRGEIEGRSVRDIKTWQGTLPWQYSVAAASDIEECLTYDHKQWSRTNFEVRFETLLKVAQRLREKRADLIGVAVTGLGKTVQEIDVEISEAIDFAEYYARKGSDLYTNESLSVEGKGTNLVISPWNFPIAIPAGGILASLAAGNYVVLKPASNAVSCAYLLCQCFWDAGVPHEVLQFMPTKSEVLKPFIENNRFASVILTGGTQTALQILDSNSYLNLYAETGGKNTTIVTAKSDKELAIKHIVQSAFSNTGQKCSATSLLILEKEVYDDEHFKSMLRDAAESQLVGSPWEFHHMIGPLAQPISGELEEALGLSNKQQWLLKPVLDKSGYFLTPGIKYGVEVSDFDQKNELFGPVLSVLRADNLGHAIKIANQSNYGLTAGLETLDEDEIDVWKNEIQAGNLYINKPTTGAVVARQPFGGMKMSSFGKGAKAGGPNYVAQFMKFTVKPKLRAVNPNIAALKDVFYSLTNDQLQLLSYAYEEAKYWWETYFSKDHEEIQVRGENNFLRYLPVDHVIHFINSQDTLLNVLMRIVMTSCLPSTVEVVLSGNQHHLSYGQLQSFKNKFDYKLIRFTNWRELEERVGFNTRIRVEKKHEVSKLFLTRLHERGQHVYAGRIIPIARLELLNYLQEQSISHAYHRHGNLMDY